MTQEFLNEEKIPFIDCNRDEQHILLDAHLNKKIESYNHPLWSDVVHETHLNYCWILRTKPIKRLAIPWEHIKPEYRWAAIDSNCAVYAYTGNEPSIITGMHFWSPSSNGCSTPLRVLNIDTSGIDWRDSLVERPDDK